MLSFLALKCQDEAGRPKLQSEVLYKCFQSEKAGRQSEDCDMFRTMVVSYVKYISCIPGMAL